MFIIFSKMTDTFVELGKYANCFTMPICESATEVASCSNMGDLYPPFVDNSSCAVGHGKPVDTPPFGPLCYNTTKCEIGLGETHQEVLDGMFEEQEDFMDVMLGFSLYYIYFGIGTWICAWVQTTFLMAQLGTKIA